MPPGLTRNTDRANATASATERCGPGHPDTTTSPQAKYHGHAAGPPAAATNRNVPSMTTRFGTRVRYSAHRPTTTVIRAVTAPNTDPSVRVPEPTPPSCSREATVQPRPVAGVMARWTLAGAENTLPETQLAPRPVTALTAARTPAVIPAA